MSEYRSRRGENENYVILGILLIWDAQNRTPVLLLLEYCIHSLVFDIMAQLNTKNDTVT